jgi:hypothetical protein
MKPEGRLVCTWKLDEDEFDVTDTWNTDCGSAFTVNHGTPHENEMRFCCYCGGILRESKRERSKI